MSRSRLKAVLYTPSAEALVPSDFANLGCDDLDDLKNIQDCATSGGSLQFHTVCSFKWEAL
jgi:hypothetical protein